MEFITEINAAVKSGLQGFKLFIEQKLSEDANYLGHPFWIENGEQVTVLNYLIQQHQEKEGKRIHEELSSDLTQFIDFVLSRVKDKNIGEPLHQALAFGKLQLALHLFDTVVFDVNRRDQEGRTLLSLVVETKNRHLLRKILKSHPDVNATTRITDARVLFQPLHQAIALDFAFGVRSLANAGADLTNPLGAMKDTPVLLAARQGKIKALEALLEFPVEKLDLEAENNRLSADKMTADNAIESLCKLLANDKNNKDLIRGVAMLLCRGAEPPRKESMCQLLADKRSDLLKEIDRYMNSRPELVDPFVNRCHLADSPLHKIIYVDHSWGSTLRQLFGRPSEAAFVIERLVTRKYSRRQEGSSESPALSTVAAVPLKGDEPPLKLYAEFVRRYNEAYQNQRITNPWSTMRWMIAEGKCNWEMVKQYARSHPGTRTQIIYDDMFKTLPKMEMHEQIENATGTLHCNVRL
ncbi:Dot/Icm T4SS effector AnkC/LegA12 [Legionella cincinnatiensis]|uniref:Ankyrin repeat protein n=1 Tax=Legionella cincinnatiensis TaxID=28085 RepID=A0A378IGS5_9GAMM|nr:Dot/Icm T4SS effector AnkC/LegA12 [Legionella cincinnatiensis]KTC82775.1 ankyrin repeat protein [Legionella cincinnatiensis]STX34206.1 ankyrin repeat protein [Legionella cincinnatiensis]